MNAEQMTEVYLRHDAAEKRGDLVGVMETVGPHPRWEFYPLGYCIEGRDAVAEFYRRLLPTMQDSISSARESGFWVNRSGIMVELEFDLVDQNNRSFNARTVGVFQFQDGMISHERGYMGAYLGNAIRTVLGEDFTNLPGVSLLL